MLDNVKKIANEVESKYKFCLLIIILQYSWQNTGLLFEELNFIQVNQTVDFK